MFKPATLVILTLVVSFYGCQEKHYSNKSLADYFTEEKEFYEQYDAYFEVKFQTGLNTPDSVTMGREAQGEAYFTREGNELLNVGDVSIGEYDFTFNPQRNSYYSQFDYRILDDLFGDEATYQVSGSDEFSAIQHQTYFPEILKASTPDIDEFSFLEEESDLKLEWNEDPSNDHKVLIALYYDGRFNHDMHEELPEDSFFKYYEVEDDGSFTIPSDELESFPKGSHGTLYMLRGHHQQKEITEEKEAGFFAVSKVSGSFIMEEEIRKDPEF